MVTSWQGVEGQCGRSTEGFYIGSVLIIKLVVDTGVFLFSYFITCMYVTLSYMCQVFLNLKNKNNH